MGVCLSRSSIEGGNRDMHTRRESRLGLLYEANMFQIEACRRCCWFLFSFRDENAEKILVFIINS